jgi:LuxR family transcriptional regulator, maltose regulon positive regulatory protein
MPEAIVVTKLHIPAPRPRAVPRPRLIERLNEGLHHRLTLISAPAGFGKTTLVSEWIAASGRPAAWISLDQGDSDPARFLAYLVAALRSVGAHIGEGVAAALQSPQSQASEPLLTALLNEINAIPRTFIVVLDDFHLVDAAPVEDALAFLLEHLPPCMHLVIATREDPRLPLARLRARGQMAELRAADLRFTPAETTEFLNRAMGLRLSAEDIAALETRTEGWIAGLQLAAISMRGRDDAAGFIRSFTGSHGFVLDYLLEEVLERQPESIQAFLLRTSILERLCGPLCDAVLAGPAGVGQETLEYLEHANLFIVSLDNERRWYRYHHLFAELLKHRQQRKAALTAELHGLASQWYEENGLELDAFHHAAAANDIERAERLIEGKGMPLYFRGAMAPVIRWLESLPASVLDAQPSLWVSYASSLMMSGRPSAVEPKLQAAEAALRSAEPGGRTRNLVGHVAAMRALVAASRNETEAMIAQSHRALECLHPDNLSVRTMTSLTLGLAYQLQGDRDAAGRVYAQAMEIGQASGNIMAAAGAASSLGQIQESENQLHPAAETYRRLLQMVGDPAHMVTGEAHHGLARILYQWNDLDAAEQHAQQCSRLARQLECDTAVACEVLRARLMLARGDTAGAAALLAKAGETARVSKFVNQVPRVAAAQVHLLLHQGNPVGAARLAESHDIPMSQVRIMLAQGDAAAARALLTTIRAQMDEKRWHDDLLEITILQALAHHARGRTDDALRHLGDALAMAQPGGFIRIFVDEGPRMAELLAVAAAKGIMPDYVSTLRDAFEPDPVPAQALIEPLSRRELEVLHLVAQGLSNHEISERLFVALSTVKGHNLKIFEKLQVKRRTEALARARELGLLRPKR